MDFVKINVNSKDLLNYGWPSDKSGSLKSLAAAYLAGLLFGNRLKKDKFEKEPAIDTGIITSTKGSRVYAALKGIIEAGIKLNHDEAMLPKENRIKNKSEDFFEKVKEKIMGGNKK
jgi:large subunit ribosomal protein L18